MALKKIEIDDGEMRSLRRGCAQARRLLAAVQTAANTIGTRLQAVERWLGVMEFRYGYAEDVEDEN